MAELNRSPWEQTPERVREDLHGGTAAGINYGTQGPHSEWTTKTAFDVKELHERLQGIRDDDLKQIPVLPEGTRLEQGAKYIDLRDTAPREFTARADQTVHAGEWVAPKDAVPYPLWNRLAGRSS
jgi:hypothetical protein